MIEGAGGDFSAKMAGKIKMVFQCAAAATCLVALALNQSQGTTIRPAWLDWALILTIWLTVISTLHSGYLYVWGAREAFLGKPSV
jgi:CDP-diacylglycerol--glycerol-3-phosphate 3-phosphatidyltransferase